MTPLVAFTIAARNFVPYATVLHQSLRQHHPDVHFVLALCDEDTGIDDAALGYDVLRLSALRDVRVWGMAERYNITEFCTAIKPMVFQTLMRRYPGHRICYFDPDILVTSPLTELEQAFAEGASMVLTPHLLQPSPRPELFADDRMLRFGAYNLGFLGVRDSAETRAAMAWWAGKLEHQCLIDLPNGLFVDQKWADLFPALLDGVRVLRHPGYNVAYWNLLERRVRFADGVWLANGEPLRFMHFSGHDVTRPAVLSRHADYLDQLGIGDIRLLLPIYRDRLLQAGLLDYAALPFAFRWNGANQVNLHTPDTLGRPTERQQAIDRAVPAFGEDGLFAVTVSSWSDWAAAAPALQAAFAAHRTVERTLLAGPEQPFMVSGTCGMCRTASAFGVSYMYAAPDQAGPVLPNWREHMDCRCGFQNRLRGAMHALETLVAPRPDAAIYVTEAVTQLYKWLRLRWPGVVGSEFFGADHAPGTQVGGVRHEDVCRLSFDDRSFDVVLSFDVLEHVEDLGAALQACFRVLRPGGALLFAAPMQFEAGPVVDRVRVSADGSYDYLAEPEYHGNPVDDSGSLCFRYFGLDVLDDLREIGFETAECMIYWSRDLGLLGPLQNVIIARKAA